MGFLQDGLVGFALSSCCWLVRFASSPSYRRLLLGQLVPPPSLEIFLLYFQSLHQVQFRDTDAAGIAHFSAFFNWMERTEHLMLRYFDWSVVKQVEQQTISWPRVATSCDFRRPLKFEQVFGVELSVDKLGRSSATYQFRFLAPEDIPEAWSTQQKNEFTLQGNLSAVSWFEQHQPLAEGSITAVCCDVVHGQRPRPLDIPATLRQHLESLQTA